MPNHYRQIPLKAAVAGMVLSDAVLDTKGHILVPKGAVLTSAMLEALGRHEIEVVAILSNTESSSDDEGERVIRFQRVERLFRKPGLVDPGADPHADAGRPASFDSLPTATAILHRYILNFRSEDLP